MPARRTHAATEELDPVQHNGLPAERFVPLAELEAGAVDGVLAALRAAEIAAYIVPIGSDDRYRLWVDETATSSARDVLTGYSSPTKAGHAAGSDHDEAIDDEAWAKIVAAYHSSPDGPVSRPSVLADGELVLPEEHFEPPAPPPLPAGDTISRLAWAGVLGGPGYLFASVLLGWPTLPWVGALAVGIFIGAFVTLIVRMRDDDEPRDDNGAVV